jgi:hypothetical protein
LLLKLYASNVLPTNYQEIIPYIGICSSIFFLLLLIYENNIKKFLCIGILSQNFIFLIFNEKSYENLSEILLHSIFSQSLFFLSIFIITFLGFSKSDFFVDLQLKIRSNKIFFIFLMISSLILIGAPGTPNFLMKNESIQIFKHKSDFNYYLILLYKILNIIVFLFVLPYKVFSLKKENQINRFEYKKSLIMFSFFLGIYIFCFKKDFDFSTQNFELNEFLYQFLISGIIFSFISKILIKNFYSFISSDMIFEKIQLNLMKINFLKYIKIFNKNYNFFVINLKNSSIINFFYKKKDQYYSLESSCIPLLFFGLGLFLIFFFLFI